MIASSFFFRSLISLYLSGKNVTFLIAVTITLTFAADVDMLAWYAAILKQAASNAKHT